MYYLGIDNGGTTTKAALYTKDGHEIAVETMVNEVLVPASGFAERDMEALWQSNCAVIKKVLKKAEISGREVSGIAVCGHGKGLYLWGNNGKPVRNGIMSTDNRACDYPVMWRNNGIEEKAFKRSAQHIMASQPISLLAWLRDNEPDTIEKTKWIFECKDYIRFRLTGVAAGERTDYSGTNLMNLYTGAYDIELLKLFGLEDCFNKLPPIVGSTEICGYITEETAELTDLKVGTPVAGGVFDIDACAIAVNAFERDTICMIAGTWSINEYVSNDPVLDGSILMNSFFAEEGKYLIEESSPTSTVNYEWFIRRILYEFYKDKKNKSEDVYEALDLCINDIPDEELCPVFLPFLMTSNVNPNAKSAFVGIDYHHTRTHLLRSIYEGIVFSHRYHLDKLLKTRNDKPQRIRLAGGAARSRIWTQMFANVLGLPIETVDVNETGTFGCAVIASVAVGDYASLKEAASAMCPVSKSINPVESAVYIYNRKYSLYLQVIEALDSVWKAFKSFH